MHKTFFTLLSVAAAALLNGCGTPDTPVAVTVAVVPNPVSIRQFEGTGPQADNAASGTFALKTRIDKKLGAEEYVLDTRGGSVKLSAGSEAGLFYGRQTLAQIAAQSPSEGLVRVIIEDKPQFAYRGVMLDCCRHFFPLESVKQVIDIAAAHKLNVLHWHLTDDQGWRFESKKYPRLSEVAAWRKETKAGHKNDPSQGYDGTPHGGFYTREQMREVVCYAAERFITVIPEIEMPGHATAALAAYPELGCTGGPYEVATTWGIFPEIFCVGKEGTIKFLEDILDEVCEVFPSEYIHIGGDEAPRTRWHDCPDCQALMKAQGFESEAQIQSCLVNTIEQYLNAKGRKIIGWDEILEGGVSKTATVMSWRGTAGGKAAAALGNDVIMTPNKFYYFDYYQTSDPAANEEMFSWGGYVNLEKAYSFDPYEDLDEAVKAHIKGIQANVWTEYIPSMESISYHMLPRLGGLCEVAWNANGRTSYPEFVERMRSSMLPLYKKNGWAFADFAFRNPPID